jgi:hypothetical protein
LTSKDRRRVSDNLRSRALACVVRGGEDGTAAVFESGGPAHGVGGTGPAPRVADDPGPGRPARTMAPGALAVGWVRRVVDADGDAGSVNDWRWKIANVVLLALLAAAIVAVAFFILGGASPTMGVRGEQ